jgi:hypothetical protein
VVGAEDFGGIMGLASGDREIGDKFGAAIWWNNFGEGTTTTTTTNMTVIGSMEHHDFLQEYLFFTNMTIIGSITTFFKNIFFLLRVPNWVQLSHLCTTQKILQNYPLNSSC